MTEELIAYLKLCPHLAGFTLNVDYLGKARSSASLSGVGKTTVLRTYTDGDVIKKSTYALWLRLPFGIDAQGNADRSRLIENLLEWVRKSNAEGKLPELSERDIAISVSCEANGEENTVAADSCVCSLALSVVYYSVR